jgi:hypothetical protein
MDEIMLAIGRSRKVFMSQEQRMFTCKIKKLPHYTLMVAMNRFGEGGKATSCYQRYGRCLESCKPLQIIATLLWPCRRQVGQG